MEKLVEVYDLRYGKVYQKMMEVDEATTHFLQYAFLEEGVEITGTMRRWVNGGKCGSWDKLSKYTSDIEKWISLKKNLDINIPLMNYLRYTFYQLDRCCFCHQSLVRYSCLNCNQGSAFC